VRTDVTPTLYRRDTDHEKQPVKWVNPPCKPRGQRIGFRQRKIKKKDGTDMGGIEQFIPLILIFAIMYFLMIRPQQKKIKEHQKMVQNLRRGDIVVTQGGLIGKVAKVKENNELDLELAEGVKVRVVQSTIADVVSKTEPASD
jgi:preprotein translocase subunit YajC